jgi:hypothetical protein
MATLHNLVASLKTAADKGDLKAVAKWARELVEFADPAPIATAAAVSAPIVDNSTLSVDAAAALYVAEADKILAARGLPHGVGGAETSGLDSQDALDLCRKLGIERQMAAYGLFGDPGAPLLPGIDFSLYNRTVMEQGQPDKVYVNGVLQ